MLRPQACGGKANKHKPDVTGKNKVTIITSCKDVKSPVTAFQGKAVLIVKAHYSARGKKDLSSK